MIDKHFKGNGEYSIDIHGGGMDLLFPHHENEASQSRCATNHELANIGCTMDLSILMVKK